MDLLANKTPADIPIVVLDTETTGLFPWLGHRVVEIGAIRIEDGKVVGELNELIQPGRKMDPGASAVNGIYDEDLVGKPTFGEILGQLHELTRDALLVAHNATFDAGFLGMELYINSRQQRDSSMIFSLDNPWLCTLQLARRNFAFGGNSLGNVARRLGVQVGAAHRALNDVHVTAEVFDRMVGRLGRRRLKTVNDLFSAQGGPIVTPIQPEVRLPETVANALTMGQRLRILYASKQGQSARIVTPCYPSQHQGVTYLIAYCHLRNDQRTFRMDRILNAQPVSDL